MQQHTEGHAASAGSADGRGILVYGAYGHTGRFVVDELLRRGRRPVLAGRDAAALERLAEAHGLEARAADVTDAAALDDAMRDVAVVVNCAGPFALTAGPLLEAALRRGAAYVDVAAEIEANEDTFSRFGAQAGAEHAVVVPAMAFFGGLGDLLATVAADDWEDADEVLVAYGLSGWRPTVGTRAAGAVSRERRDGRHVTYREGGLQYGDDLSETTEWDFPEAGARQVRSHFSMADIVTIPKHLRVPEVTCFMTVDAVTQLISPETPGPDSSDERGRSEQTFVVDVVVRRGTEQRRAAAWGRDIYAITGPLAVTAVERILEGRTRTTGVASAGAMFDAASFLDELRPDLSWSLQQASAVQAVR
ncbi:saccharopine dehydrogenase NADP-binding domain-containing protein [Agromyces sp. G08B096]|uniref:Saccharopine dehydrogenase NADP-binding domain-containing protein n=1 Tax=Agromyces sp. G08B096 TaxID=3156399 RepID=A0AAU7W7N1_9MICO